MDGITDSMDMSLSKVREIVKDREALHQSIILYIPQKAVKRCQLPLYTIFELSDLIQRVLSLTSRKCKVALIFRISWRVVKKTSCISKFGSYQHMHEATSDTLKTFTT